MQEVQEVLRRIRAEYAYDDENNLHKMAGAGGTFNLSLKQFLTEFPFRAPGVRGGAGMPRGPGVGIRISTSDQIPLQTRAASTSARHVRPTEPGLAQPVLASWHNHTFRQEYHVYS